MRFRVTIRSKHAELRGFVDAENTEELARLADSAKELGVFLASPVAPDYFPFSEYTIGAPDTTLNENYPCSAISKNSYACTRDRNHPLPHAAGNGTTIVDVW